MHLTVDRYKLTLRAVPDNSPKKETRSPRQVHKSTARKRLALGRGQGTYGHVLQLTGQHTNPRAPQLLRDSLTGSPMATLKIASSHRPLPPNPQGSPGAPTPPERAAGEAGPGEAGPGVEPGRGWGQGFPSNLTWADSQPLLPGAVLPGSPGQAARLSYSQARQGRRNSPSHPSGTFHSPGPR